MKNLSKIALLLIVCLPSVVSAQQAKQKISLLLYNGKVFTADENFSIAEAVAVDGEKIVAVGKSIDLKAKYRAAREIDLQGKLVTPGFNDAHVHFLRGALSLLNVVLTDAKSLQEAQSKIAEKVKTVKSGEWIIGRGWDNTVWTKEGKFPSRSDLDKIAPHNPVFLVRVDGHIGWVNSAALKLAGITNETKNPEGGEIERDASGEATGILKETSQSLVAGLIPPPTKEQEIKGLELALDIARKYGITSVSDNSGYETTKLYREFLRAGKLTVRVAEWQDFENSVDEIERQRSEFAAFKDDQNRLKLTALKGYVDGTLGSRTASLLAPYSDDVGNSGIPRHTPEELTKMIVERDKAGFQIALHAIGDRANRMALDGFSAALSARFSKLEIIIAPQRPPNVKKQENQSVKTENNRNKSEADSDAETFTLNPIDINEVRKLPNPKIPTEINVSSDNSTRHRIEHAQVVSPTDFKRFEELGIIASMQPSHAISDKRWAGERLGEYRVLGAYAWHLLKSYRVHIPFGTDFPVESINPYRTIYAAVSRADEQGLPVGGWQPQERLTVEAALRCHTFESAYAEFAENVKGEIKIGMFADLVVHSKDLTNVEPREILTAEPVYTIFNGAVIYEKK